MADDKHYVPGDFYRICDRTGFKVRASATQQEWTQNIVRKQSWEPRQMQDFVRGIADDQVVPMPRPRQTDVEVSQTGVATFQVQRYSDFSLGAGTPATNSGCMLSFYHQFNVFNGVAPQVTPDDL